VGATQRGGAGLRQADVSDLALAHELRHRADRIFDRSLRVHAVALIQVHVIDVQPLEAALDRLADVRGARVDPAVLGARPADESELRREHDLVTLARDRAADELLIRERAVGVRRVEQREAELERAVDRRDRLGVIAGAVEFAHAHAAEAERRDLQASEGARLHSKAPLWERSVAAADVASSTRRA
jgi:hypothetical protein